jgi:hypothetical protein
MRARSLLAALAALLYAANLGDYFIGDDFDLIGSFWGRSPAELLALLWSNESGEAWKSWGIDPALGRGYLRPLKIWLLAADAALWGTWAPGWHLTSTAVFAAVALLVHALLARALPGRPALAWCGAAAVTLHPIFAEVVPFITTREETLSIALGLGALLAFVRHRDDGRSPLPFYLLLALALLAKESSLAFLPLFAAHELARGRIGPGRPLRPLLVTWLPVAAILAAYFGLRLAAFGNFVGGSGEPTWFFQRQALAFYPRFLASLGDPTLLAFGGVPLALGLVAAPLAAAALAWRRIGARLRQDLLFFGPLWFFGSSALYTGVYFATRHHLLPAIGLAMFAVLALGALLEAGILARERRAAAALLAGALLLYLPPALTTSLEWHQAGGVVRELRAEIERSAADLPDGSAVLVADVPQLLLPPFYFGWGLLAALRDPFTPSDLADRLVIVNPRNRELTRVETPAPAGFDRVLQLRGAERVPAWVRARYQRRLARDLGLAPAPGQEQSPARRPL